ncbi:hypothetical protein [Glycomyces buryatensis]|uniref:Uncharacterized protein n=1 Tax=Glycomyces buryatensis TaxID=2570927 RepID=A0A4S8Q7I8_9ACTN|nr:hypothetical protein [Glycomyces buryatensis]THV40100.1 hypothetical protein FAB82_16370 [Glycomyces buryatensis]
MGLLSVPVDRVPACSKIDLELHRPYRTWLGFGRQRCAWCGEKWGRHGCRARESAARLFVYTATVAQKEAALVSGDLTSADLELRRPLHFHRSTATGFHNTEAPGRHRRRPRPDPNATVSLHLSNLSNPPVVAA